jgi:hypothetical protein
MSKTITVVRDQHPESPREWDNLGVMACWHRRYTLGDVQPREAPVEWLEANAPAGSLVFQLYLYDHSGLRMGTRPFGDPWDSGPVGWIVATPAAIRRAFRCRRITKEIRAQVQACVRAEVEAYDAYLRGDVWGYVVDGDDSGDRGDSCFGFYGDDLGGMKAHVPEPLHGALEEAWEARE